MNPLNKIAKDIKESNSEEYNKCNTESCAKYFKI